MNVMYHFIINMVSSREVKLEKVSIEDNPINMATKVLHLNNFRQYIKLLRMIEVL